MDIEVIFFGASQYGRTVFSNLEKDFKLSYFCDNNPEKWGQVFCGVKIISPDDVNAIENPRVIITSQYVQEITKQLFEMGIKEIEWAEIIADTSSKKKSRVLFKKYDYTNIDSLEEVDNRICLISSHLSGCNSHALYHLMPKKYRKKYEVKLLNEYDKKEDYYINMITCKMTIGTYGPISHNNEKLSLELWHGFPLKCLGDMIKSQKKQDEYIKSKWQQISKVASYSQLYNVLMSACFGIDINQYYISGMPRNDYLFKSDGIKNLSVIFKKNFHGKKIVFLMPTFRDSAIGYEKEVVKNWDNLFGFSSFCNEKFNTFLEKNNIILIAKLHPFEEDLACRYINNYQLNNVYLLTQKLLLENNFDLYEVLNSADLLITDYSSVYFDFLLLDRPVLFTPVDLEHYSKTRGFLLEPYDIWAPGPKVLDQDKLQEEIIKLLEEANYYKTERETIKNIVHYYQDGNSSERLWEMIDKMMEENASKK